MKNKIIAITRDRPPDDEFRELGFNHPELHTHGVVFEEEGFVSYAEMNLEQIKAEDEFLSHGGFDELP